MKDKKRRKQFYDNKNRNGHWTEEPQGRPISFADKYAENGGYSDKYDETRRAAVQLAKKKIDQRNKRIKIAVATFLAVVLVCTGYTVMDVHIIRHAKPAQELISKTSDSNSSISQAELSLYSRKVESVSLDNSTMLESVINEVHELGLNSVTFDAKRYDGTIGYRSNLAMVDTYGAISNAGNDSTSSIKKLINNDIVPVAKICCYMDNVLPYQNPSVAALNGGGVYYDKNGNTYLNPDSEIVYNYIHDIIRELNDIGVQVFVLYGCDLPSEISDSYNDGINTLSEKLNADFEGKIKIITPYGVTINGIDKETGKISSSMLKESVDALEPIGAEQIYSFYSDVEPSEYISLLIDKGINNFILE